MSRVNLYLAVLSLFLAAPPALATECSNSGVAPGTAPNDTEDGSATACGQSAVAGGLSSLALGTGAVANGNSSAAIGYSAGASGDFSLALGYSNDATQTYSAAVGFGNLASANSAVVFGTQSTASGVESISIGHNTYALSFRSSAFGPNSNASGERSTAIGYRAYSEQAGAIVLGSITGVLSATEYAKVGIGTSTPDEAVDVERSAEAARFQLTSFTNTATEAPQYIQRRARGTRLVPTAILSNDNLGLFSFRGYNGTSMGGSRATITAQAAGNFTDSSTPTRLIFATTPVGSTAPQSVLVITPDGKVQVKGVNLNVPDYVFEDDYELMPLNELKTFIDKNGHLPGIANAQQVKDEGLDLAGSQMNLLQKVEELTLYTLQQEGRLTEQQSQLQAQRDHLQTQQERIDHLESLLTQALARID